MQYCYYYYTNEHIYIYNILDVFKPCCMKCHIWHSGEHCTNSTVPACSVAPQVGILGVKGSYTSPLVIPLLFLTAIVAYVCRGVFERPFQVVSLRGAVDLDKHEKVGGSGVQIRLGPYKPWNPFFQSEGQLTPARNGDHPADSCITAIVAYMCRGVVRAPIPGRVAAGRRAETTRSSARAQVTASGIQGKCATVNALWLERAQPESPRWAMRAGDAADPAELSERRRSRLQSL